MCPVAEVLLLWKNRKLPTVGGKNMTPVLFYSAGPYGPLGRQLATRAAHELCRNATALQQV